MSTSRSSSTHIQTQKKTTVAYRNPDTLVGYPGEWFSVHTGRKPETKVPKCKVQNAELARSVRGGIKGISLTIETAKMYLYHYGLNMKATCETEWKSYKLVIGAAAQEITPWNIVEVKEGDEKTPTEQMIDPSASDETGARDWTERALALYILCIYRLHKITNESYRDELTKRMVLQTAAEGGRGMNFSGTSGIYGSWLNDKGFLKLVAAYDMFLNKFPDSEDAILRMGSLGSRFRDCAGLLSYGHAMSILNISAGELMDWIFIRTMAEEVMRISKEDEESGQEDSYFPYQSDLGLVKRSAYSSNANPYLFTWIHIIGTIIGHKRSENARFIFEGNLADIGLNAVLIAWAYARGGELQPQFSEDGAIYGDNITPTGDPTGEEGTDSEVGKLWLLTSGRSAKTWYGLLKSNNFTAPNIVKRVIKRQRDRIREVREDSVGDYVKNRFVC